MSNITIYLKVNNFSVSAKCFNSPHPVTFSSTDPEDVEGF